MMNSIQNLFRRNLPAKIMAIIGAVVMWGFVMNEQNPSVNSTITVPIYTMNAPEGYQVEMEVREVTLRVRAPRASFTSVKDDDFKAYVDLAEAAEGKNDIKVRTVVPQGFEVLEVSVPHVQVTLEALMEKVMSLDIQVTGNTGAGSALERIIPDKDSAKITGPRSAVSKVARLVGYLPLGNNTTDFKSKVKLTPVDSDGNIVGSVVVVPQEVEITAKIMNGVEKKLIPIKVVYSGTPARKFVVAGAVAQPERLEVIGKKDQLANMNEINTEMISIDGVQEDVNKEVNLELPDGIIVPSKRVSVKISINKVLQDK